MSAVPTSPSEAGAGASARLLAFLRDRRLPTPFLVVDPAVVSGQYEALQAALPDTAIHYAVKANPLAPVLGVLSDCGSGFDFASLDELECCLALGISAARLSFGHTIKKPSAIAHAHRAGVRRFACDSLAELEKLAAYAPGSDVCVRLSTNGQGAEWPLSRKFGCDDDTAYDLLRRAAGLGLHPHGVSFHVGSQQVDPGQWDEPIARSAALFARLRRQGIAIECLNLGGGFPARYLAPVPPIADYGAAITRAVRRHFDRRAPRLMAEPGRYLVAEAGLIETEVVLVADRAADGTRWVYLDCGKFGGLAETADEAIKYPLWSIDRHGAPTRCAIAGPTCDSADILYERTPYWLPDDIQAGDRVRIHSAGAYTHTYSAVGFNGFPPLRAVAL